MRVNEPRHARAGYCARVARNPVRRPASSTLERKMLRRDILLGCALLLSTRGLSAASVAVTPDADRVAVAAALQDFVGCKEAPLHTIAPAQTSDAQFPNLTQGVKAVGSLTLPGLHQGFSHSCRSISRHRVTVGRRCNGAACVRSQYDPPDYAAFVLDADGHNVEAVCRSTETVR